MMKSIKKIELAIIIMVTIIFLIITVDVINNLKIRSELELFLCNDFIGDCHYKVEYIYGFFHNWGSLISLLFNGDNIIFILVQILTFIIYILIIKLFFYILMKILRIIG